MTDSIAEFDLALGSGRKVAIKFSEVAAMRHSDAMKRTVDVFLKGGAAFHIIVTYDQFMHLWCGKELK